MLLQCRQRCQADLVVPADSVVCSSNAAQEGEAPIDDMSVEVPTPFDTQLAGLISGAGRDIDGLSGHFHKLPPHAFKLEFFASTVRELQDIYDIGGPTH